MSEVPVRAYCPTCEPEADPTLDVLEVRHCEAHAPDRRGLDDAQATLETTPTFDSPEAGGETNRRWCEMVHGR